MTRLRVPTPRGAMRCSTTYVGDAQRRKVVSLAVLRPRHGTRRDGASTQSRGDVGSLLGPDAAGAGGGGLVAHARGNVGRAVLANGGHGVLVRTSGCEMLPVTDTALDLLVL